MARKRARSADHEDETTARKRTAQVPFQENRSAAEEARPYLLGVARLPLDVLDEIWRVGTNRPLNEARLREFVSIFKRGGLQRSTRENFLRVRCDRASFEAARVQAPDAGTGEAAGSDGMLDLRHWRDVHGQRRLELMAGQHRVMALRRYARETGYSDEGGLYWPCEFYDEDTLPLATDRMLRMNRRDTILEDSNGEVWTQVMQAVEEDPTLLQGKSREMTDRLVQALRLEGDINFPLRRLVTVLRNRRWRELATRWCSMTLGRQTFQVSSWDWLISFRLDDYLFAVFGRVLDTMDRLPAAAARLLHADDWKVLSQHLVGDWSDSDAVDVFYPGHHALDDVEGPAQASRREGFLLSMGDEDYRSLCASLCRRPRTRLPPVLSLTSLTRNEGMVLARVMDHVVHWLNEAPAVIGFRAQADKPALWRQMVAGLGWCTVERVAGLVQERDVDIEFRVTKELGPREKGAVMLQHEILDFVVQHVREFREREQKGYLDEVVPERLEGAGYAARFEHTTWRGVLDLVRVYAGPSFRAGWDSPQAAPGQDLGVAGVSRARGVEDVASSIYRHLQMEMPEIIALYSIHDDASGGMAFRQGLIDFLRNFRPAGQRVIRFNSSHMPVLVAGETTDAISRGDAGLVDERSGHSDNREAREPVVLSDHEADERTRVASTPTSGALASECVLNPNPNSTQSMSTPAKGQTRRPLRIALPNQRRQAGEATAKGARTPRGGRDMAPSWLGEPAAVGDRR